MRIQEVENIQQSEPIFSQNVEPKNYNFVSLDTLLKNKESSQILNNIGLSQPIGTEAEPQQRGSNTNSVVDLAANFFENVEFDIFGFNEKDMESSDEELAYFMKNYEKMKNESNKKLINEGLFSLSNPVPINEAVENKQHSEIDAKYYEILGVEYAKLDVRNEIRKPCVINYINFRE